MNLILFGFKSAGKTTLGKLLANCLNRPFFDLDEEILKEHSLYKDCQSLFLEKGELFFRNEEKKALCKLVGIRNSVIATGGGSLLDEGNQVILQTMGKLIYLDTPLEIITARLKGSPAFLKEETLSEAFAKRSDLYRGIPALHVTYQNDPQLMIKEILGYGV